MQSIINGDSSYSIEAHKKRKVKTYDERVITYVNEIFDSNRVEVDLNESAPTYASLFNLRQKQFPFAKFVCAL